MRIEDIIIELPTGFQAALSVEIDTPIGLPVARVSPEDCDWTIVEIEDDNGESIDKAVLMALADLDEDGLHEAIEEQVFERLSETLYAAASDAAEQAFGF